MPGITLSALAGLSDLVALGPDAITDCNSLPGNTVTRINSTNSTAAAKNLPILIANDAQAAWAYVIPWTVQTIGFDTLYKTQIAIPTVASNNVGAGLLFVRKLENGTWGRWHPQGRMPSSVITNTAGHFYDVNSNLGRAEWGLNRLNVISAGVTVQVEKYMPHVPVEGDSFVIVTNQRVDTRLYPIGGISIRTGDVSIAPDSESLTLDSPYTPYTFTYQRDLNYWFLN